jgi:hypothetical protein
MKISLKVPPWSGAAETSAVPPKPYLRSRHGLECVYNPSSVMTFLAPENLSVTKST